MATNTCRQLMWPSSGDFFEKKKNTVMIKMCLTPQCGDRGSTVVKVLCYKSEGRWFDPSWCHRNFSLT